MAALGVAQNVRQGPKNKGAKMKVPKAFPTDYEVKVRGVYLQQP